MRKDMQEYIGKIIEGDCLNVMKELPDNCIDLVWTSPPYNLGNFKKGSFYGGKIDKGNKLKYKTHDDNMNSTEYIAWQHSIIKECYRLIKENGAIFYNHKPRVVNGFYDDRKNLLPYSTRQEIVWFKGGMLNFSGGFYAPNTERIYIIAKKNWKPNKEHLSYGEVWHISQETGNLHPAPFPIALSRKVIASASKENDLILDPFSGSGTTAIACHQLNRRFICIEKEPEYVKLSRKRLREEQMQMRLDI